MRTEINLDVDEKRAHLTLISGLDEFGHQVLDLVEEQFSVLPEALQYSTQFIFQSADELEQLLTEVQENREALTDIDNVDRIESLPEWTIARRGDRITVRHHVVGRLDTITKVSELASSVVEENRFDTVSGLCFSENLDERIHDLRRDNYSSWSQLLVASPTNREGTHLPQQAVQSTIAGTVLVSLLLGGIDQDRSRTDISTFGCTGLYGMTGPALRQLATHLARDLVSEHRSEVEDDEELPEDMLEFIEEFDPQDLGDQVLLDVDLQSQTSVEDTPLSNESIPATPNWQNGRLSVSLSEGRLGLELTQPGQEEEWAPQIREHARSFDMTTGYKWRRQLEEAASQLANGVRESFDDGIQTFLDRTSQSPARVERVLDQIEEKLEEPYRPADANIPDLDSTLSDLKEAVAERPNRLVLSLRLAVWVIPALVAGSIALNGLYGGTREVLFPILFVVIGGALAIGWALWHIQSARQKMKTERSKAIDSIARRQENILAENVVGYLNDEVIATLREALNDAKDTLSTYNETLRRVDEQLSASTENSVDTPITFEPILSRPEEYDRALERSVEDLSSWLEEALEAGVLRSGQDSGELSTNLVNWCEERLQDHLDGHPESTLDALWKIRRDVREDEDDLADAIDSLWQYSTPLAESQYAPDFSAESHVILLPDRFDQTTMDLAAADFSPESLQEFQAAPLLVSLRVGPLDLPKNQA